MAGSRGKSRRAKVRAILAGGVILGVGAAVTLAGMTDQEFATGTFRAGVFNVQGTGGDPASDVVGPGSWGDHITKDGAIELTYSVEASNLSPGDVVYAPVSFRVDPQANDYDAVIRVVGTDVVDADGGELSEYLVTMLMADTTYSSCMAGNPENWSPSSVMDLSHDSTPATMCLRVSLRAQDLEGEPTPNSIQGDSATITWHFIAESEPIAAP